MLRTLGLLISVFILRVGTRFIRFSTYLARLVFAAPDRDRLKATRVWIDVGAHRGETTFEHARTNRDIVVYAFEPDISVASHRYALLDNFIVIAMAVSDVDGFREFHINSNDRTSSLLPFDRNAMQSWPGVGNLKTARRVTVPSIRLDTFLNATGIQKVEYLKIDAQGHDLEVLQSLGSRIKQVETLKVEACAARRSIYSGAHNGADDIIAFMGSQGFEMVEDTSETAGQEVNLVFRPYAIQKCEPLAGVSSGAGGSCLQ